MLYYPYKGLLHLETAAHGFAAVQGCGTMLRAEPMSGAQAAANELSSSNKVTDYHGSCMPVADVGMQQ